MILIVEDERDLRSVCGKVLARLGFLSFEASDGEEALRLLQSHFRVIRCVFLDLILPGKSGQETLSELRRLYPALKVVICSGYSKEIALSFFLSNAHPKPDAFLEKPYRLDTVRSLLCALFPPTAPSFSPPGGEGPGGSPDPSDPAGGRAGL